MLGQRATKDGRKRLAENADFCCHLSYLLFLMFFENCLPLIVHRGGNYGKLFTICHLKVIFTEYYRVLVLFYESLTYY